MNDTPTFYDVDLRNAKVREFAYDSSWFMLPLVLPIVAIKKLSRSEFHGSTDDPPVEALGPFEVHEDEFPDEMWARIQPMQNALAALGFHSPVYHVIDNPLQSTYHRLATYQHTSGRAWARIHYRSMTHTGQHLEFCFPMFFTVLDDDSFLVSSGSIPDMTMPVAVDVTYHKGKSVDDLWQIHQAKLDDLVYRQARPVRNPGELSRGMELHHAQVRDYNLNRGVFKPLAEHRRELANVIDTVETDDHLPNEDRNVIVEMERQLKHQGSPVAGMILLGLSLFLFIMAGWDWAFLWMLIPILIVHEMGHFIAMRSFGYRNLKMFFIPFLGAAVSGRHFNVAGWKKVIVALMGPVPGIVLGGVIGFTGMQTEQPMLLGAAVLTIIVNGFNLLPLLPLDGGWVVHAILFSRHPTVEISFRMLTILAFAGLCYFTAARILWILPASMLLGLPVNWKIGKIAHRLRKEGAIAPSHEANTVPQAAAMTILNELRKVVPEQTPSKYLAQQVLSVYETVNARPPGVAASFTLLILHAASFAAALTLTVLFIMAQQGNVGDILNLAANRPKLKFERGDTDVWNGPEAPRELVDTRVVLIADFDSREAARAQFVELQDKAPNDSALRWFGQSVIMTMSGDDRAEVSHWIDNLNQRAAKVIVDVKDVPAKFRLFCVAPDMATAELIKSEFGTIRLHPTVGEILPFWTNLWEELPDKEREVYKKARLSFGKLEYLWTEAAEAPEVDELSKELAKIFDGGNKMNAEEKADAKRVEEAYKVALDKELENLKKRLRTGEDDSIDIQMFTLWDQLESIRKQREETNLKGEPRIKFLEELDQRKSKLNGRIVNRMGSLPTGDDALSIHIRSQAARRIYRESYQGLYFEIEITFSHPGDGAAALADWLHKLGCEDVYYDAIGSESFEKQPE